jgi:hypothetical protein
MINPNYLPIAHVHPALGWNENILIKCDICQFGWHWYPRCMSSGRVLRVRLHNKLAVCEEKNNDSTPHVLPPDLCETNDNYSACTKSDFHHNVTIQN